MAICGRRARQQFARNGPSRPVRKPCQIGSRPIPASGRWHRLGHKFDLHEVIKWRHRTRSPESASRYPPCRDEFTHGQLLKPARGMPLPEGTPNWPRIAAVVSASSSRLAASSAPFSECVGTVECPERGLKRAHNVTASNNRGGFFCLNDGSNLGWLRHERPCKVRAQQFLFRPPLSAPRIAPHRICTHRPRWARRAWFASFWVRSEWPAQGSRGTPGEQARGALSCRCQRCADQPSPRMGRPFPCISKAPR